MTNQEIITRGELIRDETVTGANTAQRVGEAFVAIGENLEEVKGDIQLSNIEKKGIGIESKDAIYTSTTGYVININRLEENAQGSYSSPIALLQGQTIIVKMYCGFSTAIAITNENGTTYRTVVVGEDSLILKDYKYTALEDCYVAICWRNVQSDPEYVKIITNGTLNEILNLYKDVELGRKFEHETDTIVGSRQTTYLRDIKPTIKAGTTLKIKATAINGSWTRLLFWCNELSYRVKDGLENGIEETVVIDRDIYSLGYYVLTDNSVNFTIEVKEYTKCDILEDEILEKTSAINSSIQKLEGDVIGGVDKTLNMMVNRGCFPVDTSTAHSIGDIFVGTNARLIQVPVTEGDIIEFNAEFDASFGACTYDSNYQPLSGTETLSTPQTVIRGIKDTPANHRITIESGESWLVISDRDGVGYDNKQIWAKKITNEDSILNRLNVLEESVPDSDFADYCSREALYEQDIKNTFVWKKFDKAYFSWTNDDARADMYLYQDLCEQYNYPYCPAIPWESILINPNINGTPLLQRLATIINNGGEILMHSGMGLTYENPFVSQEAKEQWRKYFKESKHIAETALNTRINVFIKAGVTTQTPPDIVETQKWCLQFYKMSDLLGNTPQYQLTRWRRATSETVDEDALIQIYKDKVDESIENHNWVRFYCHGTNELSLNVVSALFDYIQTKIQNGQAEFVTWNYMYKKFKGSQLDKLINPNNY